MPEQPRLNGRGAPQPRWQESQHYDACGRLTERVLTHSPRRRLTEQQAQPQRTRFEWDALDRLTKVTLADGTQWQYRYDPFGRRISKTRLTPQTEAERMRYKNRYQNTRRSTFEATAYMEYRWDGDLLAGERRFLADGTLTREVQWIYEPGTFRPLAQAEQTGDTLRLLHIISDQAGTPKEICTEDGRIVVENREGIWQPYLSRNNILSRQELDWYAHNDKRSDSICCDLRHPGQMYDEETGLHYNRHRYYNPETGQYLSSDPIGLAGGLNLYGYVSNPLKYIDPLGLCCKGMPTERLPTAEFGQYNYRGVHRGHPEWDNALQGKVMPGNVNSNLSAEEHNLGGFSANSPYTSWTDDPVIARRFAGEDGVILRVKTGSPKPGDLWSWEVSLDEYSEREILLKGVRSDDIEVFLP